MNENLSLEQNVILTAIRSVLNPGEFRISHNDISRINWNIILKISVNHKIFFLIYKVIFKFLPESYKHVYKKVYYDAVAKIMVDINELSLIKKIAERNNIDIILIKGLAISSLIYNNLFSRNYRDIDILVNEKDMDKLCGNLIDIGYFQAYSYDQASDIFKTIPGNKFLYRSDYHEYSLTRKTKNGMYLNVEIKRATAAIDQKYISNFLISKDTLNINNINIDTLDLKHNFLHLIANTYENSETLVAIKDNTVNMRDYIDLYVFITKYCNQINYNELVALSLKYEMTHKIYAIFRNLNDIFPYFINEDIIMLFSSSVINYSFIGNNSGYLVDWKTNFCQRIFYNSNRLKEFYKLYKKRCYSALNSKFITPKPVNPHNRANILNFNDYINISDISNQSINIKYNFLCDEKNLYIVLLLNNFTFEQFNYLKIIFRFIDTDINSLILNRDLSIFEMNDSIIVYHSDKQYVIDNIITMLGSKVLKITIPYNNFFMNLKLSNNKLCYHVHLEKRIHEEYFHCIGTSHGNIHRELGEPGVIEIEG